MDFYTVSNVVKVDEKKRDAFIKDVEKKHDALAIDRQQMNENFLGLLKNDFNTLINYSLLAIILTIIVFFRNFELTVLTMFPIVLTGVVTAGILYFLGLELNIFSTVVCTLVFGVGDDFSIFLTQAMQKEHTTGKNELPTYRTSIILAVFTTILSIGSLIFQTSCFTFISFGCFNRNVLRNHHYLNLISVLVQFADYEQG
jgi:predicted RND superfamily exporter protein